MDELRTTNTDFNIEILGLNIIGQETANAMMTLGRSMPWVQDTAALGIWNRWQVTYRDVRILDARNQVRSIYNLTEHDLGIPENRAALKQLFIAAAKIVDSDNDGLPDDWENQYFGSLSWRADQDQDRDGRNNFTEFAFGTNPSDPKAAVPFKIVARRSDGTFTFSFRRRAGSFLNYTVEVSSDLNQWTAVTKPYVLQSAKNTFDGTGTLEIAGSVEVPLDLRGFLRVRATPR